MKLFSLISLYPITKKFLKHSKHVLILPFFTVQLFTYQQLFSQTRTLTAQYVNPHSFIDANDTIGTYFKFTIPKEIPVLIGSSTKSSVIFKFRHHNYGLVSVLYKGSANGLTYEFASSDFFLSAGEKFTTDYFHLQVSSTDTSNAVVKVSLTLNWASISKSEVKVPYPKLRKKALAGNLRVGLEQNCENPILVCNNIFRTTDAYENSIYDQMDFNLPCMEGDISNGVWFRVNPLTSGNLNFTVTPNIPSDDYDFAVFDITNYSCNNISTRQSMLLACEYVLPETHSGETGPNGNNNPLSIPPVNITSGGSYLVFISNHNDGVPIYPNSPDMTGHGFSINFSASTATLFSNPVISINPANRTICAGTTAMLTATGAGIGGTYVWSRPGAVGFAMGSTINVTPLSTTTYTVVGATVGGCSSTATATITVNPTPNITIASKNKCFDNYSSVALEPISLDPNLVYQYSPSNFLSNVSGPVAYANPPVTTEYTVTGTNTFGCSSSVKAFVNVYPWPELDLTISPPTICDGQAATITSTTTPAGASIIWPQESSLTVNANSNFATIIPSVRRTYKVIGKSLGGCMTEQYVLVNVQPKPTLSVSPVPEICGGSSATLTASGNGTSYTWSPADGLNTTIGQTVIASPASSKNYTVTASNGYCTNSAVVTVNVADPALALGNTFENAIDIGELKRGCLDTSFQGLIGECHTNIFGGSGRDIIFKFTKSTKYNSPTQITSYFSQIPDINLWWLDSSKKIYKSIVSNTCKGLPSPKYCYTDTCLLGVNYLVIESLKNQIGMVQINLFRFLHPRCDSAFTNNRIDNDLNIEKVTNFEIIPNPSTNIINVTMEGTKIIQNLTGEVLFITNDLKIDISKLQAGMYLIKTIINKEEKTAKFVKQ